MKKIIISILFVLGITSMASAEVGVKVGLSGMVGLFETSGFENEDDEKNIAKAEESIAGMGSVFIEKTLGFLPGPLGRLSLGYDHVITDVKTESKTRTDNDLIGIVLLNSHPSNTNPTQIAENSVSASLDNINTIYLTARLTDWLYVKAGKQEMDVTTTETLATGSKYGNTSIDGTVLGVGLNFETIGGIFTRVEYNQTDLDGATLTSTTNADNKVTIDGIEGWSGKFSIGKSF